MQISVAWLREVLAPEKFHGAGSSENGLRASLEPRTLAAQLTMAGLEVESVEPAAPALAGVVVGRVERCRRHPNADSLTVCEVNTGAGRVQVVCGAANVRAGMNAPLATVGATLPGGVEIRRATLRGEESSGMLCSARELGLGDEAGGLLELPADLAPGTPLVDALALDDTVLGINLTPNRGDCMSVLGIARETAALHGQALPPPAIAAVAPSIQDGFPVSLTPRAGCPRFASRVIRRTRAGARSPVWLRERLRRSGVRPISAIVDATNYVMLELGQPMHAYDLRELDGGVVARRAAAGERLRLLDGREIDLDPSVLVIADRTKVLGLAGVMGGDHSGIDDHTTDVLLEAAHFAPDVIAGRGRRYGLVTDASQRFERGVDPTLPQRAIERATALILELAGGAAGPAQLAELAGELRERRAVRFRPRRARMVIGTTVEDAEMRRILTSLGMTLGESAGDEWQVTPPEWRFDIAIEEDLIEEVARIHGFDAVPETDQVAGVVFPELTETRIAPDRAADLLIERGYHEAITYSFVDPATQSLISPGATALRLANPISEDLSEMRLTLWPGLIRALRENQRRQQPRVRLFEVGHKFSVASDGEELDEVAAIAGLAAGPVLPEQWGATPVDVDFFDVKADLEALHAAAGGPEELRFESAAHPALHPGQSARIWRGERAVGWLGRLHPEVESQLGLTYSAIVFEVETTPGLTARVPRHREVSRFPAVRRDLAVVVDEKSTVADVLDRVRASAGSLLTDLVLFDVYRGTGIASGRKSLAIGLNLQDISRTLTDEETDAVVARVVTDLQREFSATIRDK